MVGRHRSSVVSNSGRRGGGRASTRVSTASSAASRLSLLRDGENTPSVGSTFDWEEAKEEAIKKNRKKFQEVQNAALRDRRERERTRLMDPPPPPTNRKARPSVPLEVSDSSFDMSEAEREAIAHNRQLFKEGQEKKRDRKMRLQQRQRSRSPSPGGDFDEENDTDGEVSSTASNSPPRKKDAGKDTRNRQAGTDEGKGDDMFAQLRRVLPRKKMPEGLKIKPQPSGKKRQAEQTSSATTKKPRTSQNEKQQEEPPQPIENDGDQQVSPPLLLPVNAEVAALQTETMVTSTPCVDGLSQPRRSLTFTPSPVANRTARKLLLTAKPPEKTSKRTSSTTTKPSNTIGIQPLGAAMNVLEHSDSDSGGEQPEAEAGQQQDIPPPPPIDPPADATFISRKSPEVRSSPAPRLPTPRIQKESRARNQITTAKASEEAKKSSPPHPPQPPPAIPGTSQSMRNSQTQGPTLRLRSSQSKSQSQKPVESEDAKETDDEGPKRKATTKKKKAPKKIMLKPKQGQRKSSRAKQQKVVEAIREEIFHADSESEPEQMEIERDQQQQPLSPGLNIPEVEEDEPAPPHPPQPPPATAGSSQSLRKSQTDAAGRSRVFTESDENEGDADAAAPGPSQPTSSANASQVAYKSLSQQSIFSVVGPSKPRPRKRQSVFDTIRENALSERLKKTARPPVVTRYVGKDKFGNYHMLKPTQFKEILDTTVPEHGLNDLQRKKLELRVNHYLEDFFVDLCERTPHPRGFFSFHFLKEQMINQHLIDEDATDYDLMKMMKDLCSKEDWRRAEGVFYPKRGKTGTDDYLYVD